jgi:uncharacterized protein (TIGR02266 family)
LTRSGREETPVEGRTILFVDDVEMFRELGALFLARAGKVVTAADGEEALAVARKDRPVMILSDLAMPGMDGTELCVAVKTDPELSGIPVILIVASELAADHARAIHAGADDVLSKPLNRVALLETVNRFLRFSTVRGLPRVEIDAPVRIRCGAIESWGQARNVSRGGLFVEAALSVPPRTEVALEFELPDTSRRLAPTARVVWQRGDKDGQRSGIGLRFVGLDARSARCLDDYVHERAPVALAVAMAEGGI